MPIWDIVPPAVISAVVSSSVAYYVARSTARRTEWSSRVDDLAKDVRQLADDTRAYWAKELTPSELTYLSVCMKVKYRDIVEQIGDLRFRPGLQAFNSSYLQRLLAEIFELSTGSDFDSPVRAVDATRAVEASERIEELRKEIARCRQRSM